MDTLLRQRCVDLVSQIQCNQLTSSMSTVCRLVSCLYMVIQICHKYPLNELGVVSFICAAFSPFYVCVSLIGCCSLSVVYVVLVCYCNYCAFIFLIGETVEQDKTLCDEAVTVNEFTYLGDRVSAGGGCEAAVTARTSYGWVKFRECSELLYGRRFPLWLKWTVYRSYVRPAIIYGSVTWCLKV